MSTLKVDGITDMEYLFYYAASFHGDIGGCDKHAFYVLRRNIVHQAIGGWNVSSVTRMRSMFNYAMTLNHPLDCWNDGSATASSALFHDATAFLAAFGRRADGQARPTAWRAR